VYRYIPHTTTTTTTEPKSGHAAESTYDLQPGPIDRPAELIIAIEIVDMNIKSLCDLLVLEIRRSYDVSACCVLIYICV
jgi:hypothetical protein